MTDQAVVFTHGHCFDGLCSAALFTRLLERERGKTRIEYRAALYGPNQNGVEASKLSGSINAILDYRFTLSENLTWYFDHHRTAFAAPEDRAGFDARGDKRWYFDANAPSCAHVIAEVSESAFGLDQKEIAEIVRWADLIDSAAFPSAAWAVECTDPIMRLAAVVEHSGDSAFITRMVPRVLGEGLEAIARTDEIERAYAPIHARSQAFVDKVRTHASVRGDVVFVDLADELIEIAAKFAAYALFPEPPYSVVLTRAPGRCKISVGYNPWSKVARRHDISAICKRHGGGGHAVVGAVALVDDVEAARKIALEIVGELSE